MKREKTKTKKPYSYTTGTTDNPRVTAEMGSASKEKVVSKPRKFKKVTSTLNDVAFMKSGPGNMDSMVGYRGTATKTKEVAKKDRMKMVEKTFAEGPDRNMSYTKKKVVIRGSGPNRVTKEKTVTKSSTGRTSRNKKITRG